MEFLNDYMLPIVVGICLCVGYIVKKWIKDLDNKYIPTIVAVLGVFLATWISEWQITPQVILSGLVSGLASTGFHQLFKQYIEKTNEQHTKLNQINNQKLENPYGFFFITNKYKEEYYGIRIKGMFC